MQEGNLINSDELNFQTRDECYKTFNIRNLRMFIISQCVLEGKASSYPTLHLSSVALHCWLLALPTNIRLGWKGLQLTNTRAYYEHS